MNKKLLRHITILALSMFIAGLMILWSWNNSIAIIFPLPEIHFKEALALMTLAFCLSFLFRSTRHYRAFWNGEQL